MGPIGREMLLARGVPVMQQIRATGGTSYAAIADALNARGIRTARGGAWHNSTVRNLFGAA